MIAPWIIEELERDRRRSQWEPTPLYIEAPPLRPQDRERESEPAPSHVIIIDYSGDDT